MPLDIFETISIMCPILSPVSQAFVGCQKLIYVDVYRVNILLIYVSATDT